MQVGSSRGFWLGGLWCVLGLCLVVNGAENDGSLLVLETDHGVSLQSRHIDLELEATDRPRVTFSVGFGTDELLVPQVFSDSFSLRLSSSQEDAEMPLVVFDAGGVSWFDEGSSNGELPLAPIEWMLRSVAPFAGEFMSAWSYQVSIVWPSALIDDGASLTMDLFDNRNELASVGWIDGIQVEVGREFRDLQVFAVSDVDGVFTVVEDFHLDAASKTIRIPREPARQFFRVQSPIPTAVEEVLVDGTDRLVRFAFLDPAPEVSRVTLAGVRGRSETVESLNFGLWRSTFSTIGEAGFIRAQVLLGEEVLSVNSHEGVLEILMGRLPVEGAATEDGEYQGILPSAVTPDGIVLPVVPETAFLRAAPNGAWVLGDIVRNADQVEVSLQQKTGRFELLESATADGPYELAPHARLDFGANAFRVPARFNQQFYRLEGGEIVHIQAEEGMVVIHYE